MIKKALIFNTLWLFHTSTVLNLKYLYNNGTYNIYEYYKRREQKTYRIIIKNIYMKFKMNFILITIVVYMSTCIFILTHHYRL